MPRVLAIVSSHIGADALFSSALAAQSVLVSVLGVLHPNPLYPLNIDAFPNIPFVKVDRWPVENGQIGIEWVLGQPCRRDFKHCLIAKPGEKEPPRLERDRRN
ncbi:MAG: hypothetical protein M3Y57_05435 [Acidobacteriota bacterium]|nr:hypothetical protein [Acidobacteriota bacterium]